MDEINKFNILIKNYNTSSSNFEIGRQELHIMSIEGLKNLLIKINEISGEDKKMITIITDELIITPENRQACVCSYNIIGTSKDFYIIIDRLDDIIKYAQNNKKQILKNVRRTTLIIFLIYVIIPISNITFIVIMLFHINQIFIRIFLLILLIFSIISIISLLPEIIPYSILILTPRFKVEYSFPFANEIDSEDITKIILLTGQYAYYIFFLLLTHLGFLVSFNNLDALNIALWVFFSISTIFLLIFIAFIIIHYKIIKKKKRKILKLLINKFYEFDDKNIEFKHYYFQLANEIRNTPIIKMKLLSKFISFIAFGISVLPLLI